MLTHIHVKDFATIEELNLSLKHGSTMITGETGAGKSIFIEAIELALGGRASGNLVRAGKEKAEISLSFDITSFPKVHAYLKEHDLEIDTPECIIRRVITQEGRSRCYVNGSPTTLQAAKELGELLFHLHGQYDQQVLLKSDNQRDMLDRFADHLPLTVKIKHVAEKIREVSNQIESLRTQSQDKHQRAEFLRYQVDEFQTIDLQADEWDALEKEHHLLTHAGDMLTHLQDALACLNGDGRQAIQPGLSHIKKCLETAIHVEPKAKEWIASIESLLIQIGDLESELDSYIEKTDLDPTRLRQVEERVSAIYSLARKHKVQPKELAARQEALEAELASLDNSDETIKQLEEKKVVFEKEYAELSKQLTVSRQAAAKKLEKTITQTIRSLSLPHADFRIVLEADLSEFSIHGAERTSFQIKTNPDQALQPLAKVISGGELSRLSLAAHLALAHNTTIPTLIFDEVDTGLSGATAEKIGKLLRKLGDSYQLFCVTHQPQVAACGHHHLLVEKYFIEKATYTRLRLLDNKDKTSEIARMLGGEKITSTTLKHAKEVLESV